MSKYLKIDEHRVLRIDDNGRRIKLVLSLEPLRLQELIETKSERGNGGGANFRDATNNKDPWNEHFDSQDLKEITIDEIINIFKSYIDVYYDKRISFLEEKIKNKDLLLEKLNNINIEFEKYYELNFYRGHPSYCGLIDSKYYNISDYLSFKDTLEDSILESGYEQILKEISKEAFQELCLNIQEAEIKEFILKKNLEILKLNKEKYKSKNLNFKLIL